jgi:PAS domain S-box-containing protein
VLIEYVLEAAATGSMEALERYVDALVAARMRDDDASGDFLLALAETRRVLGERQKADTSDAAVHAHWRVLKHAEEYFLRGVAACAQARRPANDRKIALFEGLPQALVLLDEKGRVQYANAKVRAVFGQAPRQTLGKHFLDLLKPRLLPRLAAANAHLSTTVKILTAPKEAHEDVFRLVDGTTYVRRALPVVGPGGPRQLITITDVTPRSHLGRATRQTAHRISRPRRQVARLSSATAA